MFAMSSSLTSFCSVSEAVPRSNDNAFVSTQVIAMSMTLQFSADVCQNLPVPHFYSTIIDHSTHFGKVPSLMRFAAQAHASAQCCTCMQQVHTCCMLLQPMSLMLHDYATHFFNVKVK